MFDPTAGGLPRVPFAGYRQGRDLVATRRRVRSPAPTISWGGGVGATLRSPESVDSVRTTCPDALAGFGGGSVGP
jgi:hypothetical protein